MARPFTLGTDMRAAAKVPLFESLALDLKRIAEGSGPTAADLAQSPLLDLYSLRVRTCVCLAGSVIGHPVLGATDIVTSQVFALDTGGGWARTLSRWYRLGNSLEDSAAELERQFRSKP